MRIIFSVLLLSFVVLLTVAITSGAPPLLVSNQTSLKIESLRVQVGGARQTLPGLSPGEHRSLPLRLKQDGLLAVEVVFEDGSRRAVQGGYFTPAMAQSKVLTIVSADSLCIQTR